MKGPMWTGKQLRAHWEGKLKRVNRLHSQSSQKHREASTAGRQTAPPEQPTMLSTEAQRSDFAAANVVRRREEKRKRAQA